jgi:S1-C subfamily serine protease
VKNFLLAILFATSGFLAGCSTFSEQQEVAEIESAVSVVSDAGGGGSGVVLSSSSSASYILSNRHVCQGMAGGGYVTTKTGMRSRIAAMKMSKNHDLCLVKVNRNLYLKTSVAQSESKRGDLAVVVGHPHLLPQIEAVGKFTGFMDVTMMIGVERCTEEDLSKPGDEGMMCAIFGVKPIVETFETQAISSIIAPGNSGSGVFNSKGELVNLVFAGVGGSLSHGITVPNGYVRSFLKTEASRLKWQTPAELKKSKNSGFSTPKILKIENK